MANIDRENFAFAVAGKLHSFGIGGPRPAQQKFPAVKAATWSRLSNSRPLTDANMAAVCKVLDLDIRDYVNLDAPNPQDMRRKNTQWKQTVARHVSRENAETGQ